MNTKKLFQLNRVVLLLCSVGLVVLAVTMLTAATHAEPSTSSSDGVDQSVPGPMYPPQVSPAEQASSKAVFADRFSLLREGEDVTLATMAIDDPGIDREAARAIAFASADRLDRAGAASPNAQVWVAPRYDGTQCLLPLQAGATGPAQACATPEQAANGYLLLTLSRSERDVEVYGLVPDGIESVVVTLSDGSRSELPVVANAYAARFTQPTTTLAFTDADGVKHQLGLRSDG